MAEAQDVLAELEALHREGWCACRSSTLPARIESVLRSLIMTGADSDERDALITDPLVGAIRTQRERAEAAERELRDRELHHFEAEQARAAAEAKLAQIESDDRSVIERFADSAAAQFDSSLDYDGAEVKRRILMDAHLQAPDHPTRAADCSVCHDDDRLDWKE